MVSHQPNAVALVTLGSFPSLVAFPSLPPLESSIMLYFLNNAVENVHLWAVARKTTETRRGMKSEPRSREQNRREQHRLEPHFLFPLFLGVASLEIF